VYRSDVYTMGLVWMDEALFLVLVCSARRLGVRVKHFTIDALVDAFDGNGSIENSHYNWCRISCLQ
jgi:hypothetical protein